MQSQPEVYEFSRRRKISEFINKKNKSKKSNIKGVSNKRCKLTAFSHSAIVQF